MPQIKFHEIITQINSQSSNNQTKRKQNLAGKPTYGVDDVTRVITDWEVI